MTTYLVGVYTLDFERVWICNAEADLASQNINERDLLELLILELRKTHGNV